MKKSIVLSALISLFSAGLFAATPANGDNTEINNDVTINPRRSTIGVLVNVKEHLNQQPVISVSDDDGHQLYKSALPNYAGAVKKLNLSQLDEGNYTVTISAGHQEIKKEVHIYEEYGQKTYFILQ